MRKQRIYLLIGLPGSGKSTWTANQIDNETNPRGIGVVSRDAIRYMINGNYKYDTSQQDLITRIAGVSAISILEAGHDLVIDQANINAEIRQEVTEFIRGVTDREDVEIWFVYFQINDIDILVERRMVGDCRGEYGRYHYNVIKKMKTNFEPPHSTEDYNVLLYIDDEGGVSDKCVKCGVDVKVEEEIPLEELWNLHNTIAQYIYPRLKAFREKHGGAPGCFDYKNGEPRYSEKYGPHNKRKICFKEWDKILDKMIIGFELWLSQDDWDCEYNSKEHNKRWSRIEEGMNLFIKHFNGSWW